MSTQTSAKAALQPHELVDHLATAFESPILDAASAARILAYLRGMAVARLASVVKSIPVMGREALRAYRARGVPVAWDLLNNDMAVVFTIALRHAKTTATERQAGRLLRACVDADEVGLTAPVRTRLLLAVRGLSDDAIDGARALEREAQRKRGQGGPEKRAALEARDNALRKRHAALQAAGDPEFASKTGAAFGVSTRTVSNVVYGRKRKAP